MDTHVNSSGNIEGGFVRKMREFEGLAMSIGNGNVDRELSRSEDTEGSSNGSYGMTAGAGQIGKKRNQLVSPNITEDGKAQKLSNKIPAAEVGLYREKVIDPPSNIRSKSMTKMKTTLELNNSSDSNAKSSSIDTQQPSKPNEAWLQNEQELKRERRKQSNRESARRSRLRKQVSLHGGQVISWKNNRGEELLFTSRKAILKAPKAMRGGICVCFPQFRNCGLFEQHGFAKNRLWKVDDNPPPFHSNDSCGKSYIDLLLQPTEDDLKCWPHCFEFRLRVSLAFDGNLMLISRIRNINGKPFSFSFAYHTYLSVSDISEVRIEGLETLDYLDNLSQQERFTEQGDAITFESEIDRVYLSSSPCIAVLDHERKRTCVVRKEGLPDVVVWNPWNKKSKAMADFGDEEYKKMLCIDGAAIEKKITLKPGEEWTGHVELAAIPSTFCSDNLHPRLKLF